MQMLVLEQEGSGNFDKINKRLSDRLLRIKTANPRGWADQWDMQIDNIGCEIAAELGGRYTYRDGKDHVLVFVFPPMSLEDAERLGQAPGIVELR